MEILEPEERLSEIERRYGVRPKIPMGHGDVLLGLHFRAVTSDERKFVYCPVGFIVSWYAEDFDHLWCHWCKKHFNELNGL